MTIRTFTRSAALALLAALVVVGSVAQASWRPRTPARAGAVTACPAGSLRATYTLVFGSNATGHVEYLLTIANRSANRACALTAPPALTLLGAHGQTLPTQARFSPAHSYRVTLARGQWAQATAELSPDLAGPGEPARGNCEAVAHALRIRVAAGAVRAPMDPTPVCQKGAMFFGRLKAVPITPRCAPSSLRASVKRQAPPFAGFAEYALTLRNASSRGCHADSIVGLRLLGASGNRLATRVQAGVSSPVVIGAGVVDTAVARVSTRGGACDAPAAAVAITPLRGRGALNAAVTPAVKVCRGGLIQLSSLFHNG